MSTGIKISDILGGQAYPKANENKGKKELDKEAFLKLLTTQLRYQDPSQPQDSSQMAAQLAQFSSVEQLTNLNKTMTKSIENMQLMNASINNTLASGMVGKKVRAYTESLNVHNDNNIHIVFEAKSSYSKVEIEILDSNDKVIKKVSLDKSRIKTGENSFEWDLKDKNGKKVAEGSYKLRINSIGTDNSKKAIASFVQGEVQRIQYGQNGTSLIIDGAVVPMSYIREIMK